MKFTHRIRWCAAAAILSLSACSTTGTATEPTNNAPRGPEAIARDLVVKRAGVEPNAVEIISVEAIEFSDSSLDCPQADMAYLQVITPGYKVIASFETADSMGTFDIRISGQHGFICDRPSKTAPRKTR